MRFVVWLEAAGESSLRIDETPRMRIRDRPSPVSILAFTSNTSELFKFEKFHILHTTLFNKYSPFGSITRGYFSIQF